MCSKLIAPLKKTQPPLPQRGKKVTPQLLFIRKIQGHKLTRITGPITKDASKNNRNLTVEHCTLKLSCTDRAGIQTGTGTGTGTKTP